MKPPRPLPDTNLPPYTGGRKEMIGAAAAGAAGLVLTLIGAIFSPQRALLAYLIAWVYWLGLAIGAITMVMGHHAAGARWNVSIRRYSETFGATVPLFAVLFIPLLLGARHVWFWVSPHEPLPKEMHELLQHKRPYLNLGFFTLRAVLYFAVWTAYGWLLRAWSLRQDETADPAFTVRARWWSPPGLLIFAITFTFGAFDWLMSLQPTWYSTIFGLYIYIGSFVGSVALLCLVITGVRSSGSPLGAVISADQQHNAGKLLFAFTVFWAYMAFSQYMLIWAGNLPEELQWIVVRSRGVWRPVAILILVGHFVVPFFLLLSRDLKRSAPALGGIAAWMLVIHYIDLYWVVMPAADGSRLGLHWTHLTAFVGVGGLAVAAGLLLFRAARPVPVGDPFLQDSLRYVQP